MILGQGRWKRFLKHLGRKSADRSREIYFLLSRVATSRKLFACAAICFLLWLFVDADSYVLWWLWWCVRKAPSVDERLIQGCDVEPEYSAPLAIVVPLIASQSQRLRLSMERWKRPDGLPCLGSVPSKRRPDLIFYFDRPLQEAETTRAVTGIKQFIADRNLALVLSKCFANISFSSASLTASESLNSNRIDLRRNLVQTRGSNAQFWAAFRVHSMYRHMFYMEPDTWPIRPNWLPQIERLAKDSSFWMQGTVMRYQPRFLIAPEPFRTMYTWHINGNAVYNIGNRCFARYRQLTREVYGDAAYDVALAYFRLSRRNYMTAHAVASHFSITNVIIDLGVERIPSLAELRARFPDTFLVHGKHNYVYKQLGLAQ